MALKSVVVAAGGTGGHLFPAYALSEELLRRGYMVDLMTDMRGDRYGADFPARKVYQVSSATLAGKNPLALIKTLYKLTKGTLGAYWHLGKIKPKAVVGFGGYPTFPPLIAAKLRNVPSAVHEQNAVMGRSNRFMLPLVKRIAASFDQTKHIPAKAQDKIRVTGNPVRQVVLDGRDENYIPSEAGDDFNLLVFGGSQGASFFSDTVPKAIALLPENLRERLRIVQQCREEDKEAVRKEYDSLGVKSMIEPFFTDLPEMMAHAHLVICRSGASSIAELSVLGRPSLLVPYPYALDHDQQQNAARLMEAGGAWCIEQKDLTAEVMAEKLKGFLEDHQILAKAAAAAKEVGKPAAVQILADMVEEMVNGTGK